MNYATYLQRYLSAIKQPSLLRPNDIYRAWETDSTVEALADRNNALSQGFEDLVDSAQEVSHEGV